MSNIRETILADFGEEAALYYDEHYTELENGDCISFDGMNCDDWSDDSYCSGWDGQDRRCTCGNRRVDWVWENGILYAEAY